jgi:hypothetical protein
VRSFPVLGVAKDVPLPVQEIAATGMQVGQGA